MCTLTPRARQRGNTLLEIVLAIGLIGALTASTAVLTEQFAERGRAQAAALQLRTFHAAVREEVANCAIHQPMSNDAGDSQHTDLFQTCRWLEERAIRPVDLVDRDLLPPSWTGDALVGMLNPYNQEYAAVVIADRINTNLAGAALTDQTSYRIISYTTGGMALEPGRLNDIAGQIGALGGYIGCQASDWAVAAGTLTCPVADLELVGAEGGWRLPLAGLEPVHSTGAAAIPAFQSGHLAMVENLSDPQILGDTIQRRDMANHPGSNRMFTDLHMGDHVIDELSEVRLVQPVTPDDPAYDPANEVIDGSPQVLHKAHAIVLEDLYRGVIDADTLNSVAEVRFTDAVTFESHLQTTTDALGNPTDINLGVTNAAGRLTARGLFSNSLVTHGEACTTTGMFAMATADGATQVVQCAPPIDNDAGAPIWQRTFGGHTIMAEFDMPGSSNPKLQGLSGAGQLTDDGVNPVAIERRASCRDVLAANDPLLSATQLDDLDSRYQLIGCFGSGGRSIHRVGYGGCVQCIDPDPDVAGDERCRCHVPVFVDCVDGHCEDVDGGGPHDMLNVNQPVTSKLEWVRPWDYFHLTPTLADGSEGSGPSWWSEWHNRNPTNHFNRNPWRGTVRDWSSDTQNDSNVHTDIDVLRNECVMRVAEPYYDTLNGVSPYRIQAVCRKL